ncbi:MAG: GNAT family N-acetyltransferase [Erythrobacter sp.]|uniref:GNAT family N-acetyltransferase n=1 Tax=Erythrobacter sp. TaxID=1042 RepID=UPI002604FB0D|nr:GNAT family N-acetyltransferase [Erythrobacter sp.]MDJ0977076.1 GNAT family N-acetyltransferase [Erythrobacter sp.]
MFHRSPRLLLRPIWPEDWKLVLGGIADEGVVRNLARAPWPYKEDDARRFTALPVEPHVPRFLITRARDASLIGCIGIERSDAFEGGPDDTVELGYWIARQHWRRGYATEAGRAVLEIARTLGYTQVMAMHFLDNPASGRVLKKLGFCATGVVTQRHSCGRGGKAAAREFRLDLQDAGVSVQQAA